MDRRLDDLRTQLQTAQWGDSKILHGCLINMVDVISEMSAKLDQAHGCLVGTGWLDVRVKPQSMQILPCGTPIAKGEVLQAIQDVRDEIERLRKLAPTEEELTAIKQARDHFRETHSDGYFGTGWAGTKIDEFLSRQNKPLKGED